MDRIDSKENILFSASVTMSFMADNDNIRVMETSDTKTITINPWLLLLGASFLAFLFGVIGLVTTFFIVRALILYEFGLNSFTYYLN